MKKSTRKLLLLMLTALCTSAFAQVSPTGFWNRVGDASSYTSYTDADNGDGAADGALKIVGQSVIAGQGILFDFDGTMQNGTTYTIDTVIYNDGTLTNAPSVKITLWNKTDNLQLAAANAGASYTLNATTPLATVNFSYTATAAEDGKILELRYIRTDAAQVNRIFAIDFAKLNTTTITDSFPPAVSVAGTWSPILNGAGSVQLLPATNDANNGDGVADGAVRVDGLTAIAGIGAAYTFTQPMVTGTTYEFGTTLYNTSSSFCNLGSWSLWNKTDNVQRAVYVSSNINIGPNTGLNPLKYFYYTAVAADDGDVMELRYITNDAATARDFWIDNITLNGVINNLNNTTWNGTAWDLAAPTSSLNAIISSDYTTGANITAKSLTVSNNANVSVTSGKNVTLAGALNVNSGSTFTLESNANLIQTTNAANSGVITAKRASAPLFRLDYTLWSSPTGISQKLNEFSPLTTSGRFYTYDPSTNKYAVTADDTPFSQGKGFLIRVPNTWVDYVDGTSIPASWTGSFTGIPNNGDISVPVTASSYNAIGNPYPSAIDANNFLGANNTIGALYYWRKKNAAIVSSAYATYTLAGGVANDGGITPTPFIQVGQGFIVQPTVATVSFNNTMRTQNIAVTTGSSDASWTGTSFASPGYTHTPGSTTDLTQSFAPLVGVTYTISYTIGLNATPAGSVTFNFGGSSSAAIPVATTATNGTFNVTATNTNSLAITPTSDFNGSVIIKSITPSTSGSFLRTKAVAQPGRVWLNLSQGTDTVNQMLVAYMDGATTGVDIGIDGKYINDSATALTSDIAGGEYVIQGRALPFDASDVVPLNFKAENSGTFTIAKDHTDGLFTTGQDIYLVDATTGTETNLQTDAYTFTAPVGANNARFSLKYQKTLGVNTPAFNDNSVKVYKNNGILTVSSSANTISNIKVYDIQGRLLVEQKNVNAASATIKNLRASQQVLLVKVTSADNSVVTKKVIN